MLTQNPIIYFNSYCDDNLKQCGDFFVSQWCDFFREDRFKNVASGFDSLPIDFVPNRTPHWNKVFLAKQKIRYLYDWYIYVDCDSAILNRKQDFSFLNDLDKNKSFFVAKDWNGLCTAAFAMRGGGYKTWNKELLDTWWFVGNVEPEIDEEFGEGLGPKYEQNALRLLYNSFPDLKKKIGFLPDWFINDNPDLNGDRKNLPMFWHYGAANSIEKKRWVLENIVKRKL